MRIVTWNVNCFNPNRAQDKQKLLELTEWDVALLQEVGPATFDVFTTADDVAGVSAVDLAGGPWGRWTHGAAVLVRAPAVITSSDLVPLEPDPVPGTDLDEGHDPDAHEHYERRRRARLLSATIALDGRTLTVASFHSLDAAGGGDVRLRKVAQKERLYRSLDRWCRSAPRPTVVGADINGWTDEVVPVEIDPSHQQQTLQRFTMPGADHGLRDVLVDHLRTNDPETLARRQALGAVGPDGALAVTYQRSTRNHPRANRMDRIYASLDLAVRDVETHYSDALTVGSDHALVVAELAWADDPPSARP